MRRRLLGDEHPYTLSALDRLANVLQRLRKYVEVVELRREEFGLRKKLHGEVSTDTLECLSDLALALENAGDSAGAEAAYEDLIRLAQKLFGQNTEDSIPATGKMRIRAALQRIAELFEGTGSEKASEWKTKVAEFDRREGKPPSTVPKP
jgi:hypothetical protein